TYVFQITDANGCTYSESYTVAPVTNITVAGQLVRNITCNPGANGEVLFTVGNFAGTYSYSLNGAPAVTGQTSATISVTGITASGPQTVVITDEITTCTATATVNVAQPAALALIVASNINANCNTGAKVSVTASGGTAPYQYSFVPATATGPGTYADSNAAVLDPATLNWKVYVKDVNGCEITAPLAFSIIKDASPTMTAPAPICFTGAPVAIDLSLVATVPVTGTRVYRVNGSDITGSVYTVTTPGTYLFSVVDANGCESNIITYEVKPQVTLVASLDQDLTCVVNASISLTPGGGTGTYTTYEVKINAGGYNPITLPYNPSVDGSYTFRVTDSQGCTAVSNVVIVTPKTDPRASAVATDVSCNGGSNGSITVTASNGIAPYKYQLSQGGTVL
ncbi:SprB repeat-containing protein, partial [Flavobacterium resistens]